MTGRKEPRTVRLMAAAQADLQHIVHWTRERFGDAQALAYAQTLALALNSLQEEDARIGARRRDDIQPGSFTLHVARGGRKGRHVIVFRIVGSEDRQAIEVLRLLHDSMDLLTQIAQPVGVGALSR